MSVPPSFTVEVDPPPPHAAITNKPTHASASARTRVTTCIRVLPLLTDDPAAFFPESLVFRGESAPAAGLTQQPSGAEQNSLAPSQRVSSMRYPGLPNNRSVLPSSRHLGAM